MVAKKIPRRGTDPRSEKLSAPFVAAAVVEVVPVALVVMMFWVVISLVVMRISGGYTGEPRMEVLKGSRHFTT